MPSGVLSLVRREEALGYLYILMTIVLTVYGQVVIKWQINLSGSMPAGAAAITIYLSKLFLNVWILSGLLAYGLAALAWMATMSKFELSYAYPFMSLAFVLVVFLSVFFFNEPLTQHKILGTALVVAGIIVISQG